MKKIAVSVTGVSTLSTKEIYWALGKYGGWGNTTKEKFQQNTEVGDVYRLKGGN